MPTLGPADWLPYLALLVAVIALIGGVIYAAVKAATRRSGRGTR